MIRNAGGIATDDAIRSLIVSHHLLDTQEFIIINHTDCGLLKVKEYELRAMAKDLGITESLSLTGFQTNIADWLSAADINVLPTFYDGFPLTILEAMASGLPTVASNVGGIPEAIQNGTSGLLVPPGDSQKLAEALSILIGKRDTRTRMGSAARECAMERFVIDEQVRRTEEMYQITQVFVLMALISPCS